MPQLYAHYKTLILNYNYWQAISQYGFAFYIIGRKNILRWYILAIYYRTHDNLKLLATGIVIRNKHFSSIKEWHLARQWKLIMRTYQYHYIWNTTHSRICRTCGLNESRHIQDGKCTNKICRINSALVSDTPFPYIE